MSGEYWVSPMIIKHWRGHIANPKPKKIYAKGIIWTSGIDKHLRCSVNQCSNPPIGAILDAKKPWRIAREMHGEDSTNFSFFQTIEEDNNEESWCRILECNKAYLIRTYLFYLEDNLANMSQLNILGKDNTNRASVITLDGVGQSHLK